MPSPNTIKTYVEDGYYHIYNRGVEKRRIFADSADYSKFLYFLKIYLTPVDTLYQQEPLLRPYVVNNNLSESLDLLAFCLMHNHFHLLVRQKTKDAITKLARQIMTGYSMYFNKRYGRIGSLFQGVFKASMIDSDEYLLHLSRYIHLNPKERGIAPMDYEWSSYACYVGKKDFIWLNTKIISDYFKSKNPDLNYEKFVEEFRQSTLSKTLTIEDPLES